MRSLSGTVYICQSTKCFILIFSTNTICESLFIYRSLCHTVCLKFGFKKAASHNTNYSLPPPPPSVDWVERNRDELDRQYFARVHQLSLSQKFPVVLDEEVGPHWDCLEPWWDRLLVPLNIGPPEVFVEKAGLSDTIVLTPPRRKQPWFLRTTVNHPKVMPPPHWLALKAHKVQRSFLRPPQKKETNGI